LIINRIVPKLPSDCLRDMIRLLRPITDETLETPSKNMNLTPLFRLLANTPVHDPLLNDFLSSSGYQPCQAWPIHINITQLLMHHRPSDLKRSFIPLTLELSACLSIDCILTKRYRSLLDISLALAISLRCLVSSCSQASTVFTNSSHSSLELS